MVFTPVIALGFANPLLLWGLGAASIPLVIHLLNRRRFRETRWAAMRFLRAAIEKNRRRIQIEHWLLLAVRTLLVIALVLAMAKPFLERSGAMSFLSDRRTHWVYLIDGSLSMSVKDGDEARFDTAKAVIADIIRSSRPGDGFSLVEMGRPPRVVVGAAVYQKESVLESLQSMRATHGAVDLAASFERIAEVLDASEAGQSEVVIVTDLQASSWRVAEDARQELEALIEGLQDRRARFTLLDMGKTVIENHAVTDLRIEPPVITPRTPSTVLATVRNFGTTAAGPLRAQLVVNGRVASEQTVQLAPNEDQVLVFAHQFTAAGEQALELRIDGDSLGVDDHRYLSLPVRESVRVLLVDGDLRAEPLKSESGFLAVALAPLDEEAAAGVSGVTPLEVEVVGESQLTRGDLSMWDAIVLCNVARFTATEVAALGNAVERGAGLVVFAGDRVVSENYNALLGPAGLKLLPAEMGATVGELGPGSSPFEFDPVGFEHPLVAAFAGEAPGVTASLTNVKTMRYLRLGLPEDSLARVALRFQGGDPAVVESTTGQGRVVMVASTADADWTSWPLHQSYPPVMEQIMLLVASGRAADRTIAVGQPLTAAFGPSGAGLAAAIEPPDGPTAEVRLVADGELSRLTFVPTMLSGPYTVTVPAPIDRRSLYAANVDPAESDPARTEPAALRTALPDWEFTHLDNWQALRWDSVTAGHRGEFHRIFLWAVLGLLMLESLLAWRFGNRALNRS